MRLSQASPTRPNFFLFSKTLFCDIIPLAQTLSIHRSILTNLFATSYFNSIFFLFCLFLLSSISSTIPPRHASRSPHWACGQAICREEQHAQQFDRRFLQSWSVESFSIYCFSQEDGVKLHGLFVKATGPDTNITFHRQLPVNNRPPTPNPPTQELAKLTWTFIILMRQIYHHRSSASDRIPPDRLRMRALQAIRQMQAQLRIMR